MREDPMSPSTLAGAADKDHKVVPPRAPYTIRQTHTQTPHFHKYVLDVNQFVFSLFLFRSTQLHGALWCNFN